MITDYKKFETEDALQAHCVTTWKNKYRGLRDLLYMVTNDGKKSRLQGAIDTGRGLTPGIPDLFLAIPTSKFHGLYIEMKLPGKTLSDSQKKVIPQLRKQGYKVEVCFYFEEFETIINTYLHET